MIKYAPAPLARSGVPATAEDISAKRRLAQALMSDATNPAPVGHWTQALARAVQGASAGMANSQAASDATAREAYDEKQSAAKRMAEREAAFQDAVRRTEYERSLPPTEKEKLSLDLQRAQLSKLERDAAGGTAKYGKTGQVFQGPDGAFYTLQFAEDGTTKIAPVQAPGQTAPQQPIPAPPPDGVGRYSAPALSPQQPAPVPLTPARGVMAVGDELIDRATGGGVRNVGGNLAEAERQKELGGSRGKAEASAPSDISASDTALDLIQSIKTDPYRQRGTGVSSFFNILPGTGGYDFQNKVDQAKSGAFLTAIQQMRGLGALSNAEGQTATQAVTRMNTATSEEAFAEALDDYEKIVRKGRDAARRRLQGGGPGEVPPSAPDPLGIR